MVKEEKRRVLPVWRYMRCTCEILANRKYNHRRTGMYRVIETGEKKEEKLKIETLTLVCKTCKKVYVYELVKKINKENLEDL